MIDRLVGSIRGIRRHRTGLDSYIDAVQNGSRSVGPKYDEARKDFNNRIRGEISGFLS